MVNRLLILAVLAGVGFAHSTGAQETSHDDVRKRRIEKRGQNSPYWDGFILKHEGNCTDAIAKLAPIAKLGFGYEDAQTALGECYLDLAGLRGEGGTAPSREAVVDNAHFIKALKWIGTAANAGYYEAQAVMVKLYAANLGPDEDILEAAKWAHLYLTNPQRLNLGVPVQITLALDKLRASMGRDSWLTGKERARSWVPVYEKPEETTETNNKTNNKMP